MAALLSFFIALSLSLIILRIATHILRLTGLSYDVALFQARSAFTGTGFTTRESETVMNHPLRRKVVLMLMFVRNVGFITVVSSLVLSFFGVSMDMDLIIKLSILLGGLIFLYLLSRIKLLDRFLLFIVRKVMEKSTKPHIQDFESLLNLAGEFEVSEGQVLEQSWMANKMLAELKLPEEGVLVLGIKRNDGTFIGTPDGKTVIYPEDRIVMYGREDLIRKIGARKAGSVGDAEHTEEVKRHQMQEGKPVEVKKGGWVFWAGYWAV